MQITPVLMCGGSGTRLWPLSRESYPKQFTSLKGGKTLFQESVGRLSGEGFAPPIVVTNSDFRFIVTEQLLGAGIDPGAILIEPDRRNTAPAVLAAALHAFAEDPDALLIVAPSDHVIPDADAFRAAIQAGTERALAGDLVTFGIVPTHPETGYGYLQLDGEAEPGKPAPLSRFVEKPDAASAAKMLAAGNYLWNAGIFLFTARAVITAFEQHAAQLVDPVRKSVENAKADLGFLRLDPASWSAAEDISIDYAIMEKAKNICSVPFEGKWSDLGDWNAVWAESNPDSHGVATNGNAAAIDCKDVLLRSESEGQQIVGLGLDGIVAIAMPDAVLVADKSRTQDVKKAVELLKSQQAPQAVQFPRDHRPWGYFDSLATGRRFQVKRIVVKPGAALSLQSHFHRSEHWIVVQGTARVTVDGTQKLVAENQSVYIPLGAVHRMENPGKLDMVLIEVQTGSYLGEDDIVRYEDVYARNETD
ncbi:mannose-1-phosphate guanylyltransferase/mannose-6-phosphate isomerase [Leisingera aquaemixtae]|uniref:mannose-1-phosphate guanylyltransferase n=1 Tax=Leisingera aquaemixtae TaxID=1396826 RepID=A0A0P1HYV8_9RHOB|nr:mannose-1-phosphate guanylyltransferase/mannose-6-phosphate isomerase [Leisingera aquaemixtae]UWQ24902.1 mannose-1-phosphate guanylyltransferase/mannose-6-phosphate isomerase [Leisingera aquaemixtae]UWQ45798.1 mannose-1-phosphate guanylyltransferase/mannose-6-phosphate isomerase [Leisingera aquaemixtae]CUI01565.1 Alginate biosynthesis protein AlgA [Leisingera aquaemixtae]